MELCTKTTSVEGEAVIDFIAVRNVKILKNSERLKREKGIRCMRNATGVLSTKKWLWKVDSKDLKTEAVGLRIMQF